MCVRSPAARPFFSRSYPSTPPRAAAVRSRSVMRVTWAASGTSENSSRTVSATCCSHPAMSNSWGEGSHPGG